ncbi:hypothetical protein B0H11DRAFT_1254999 [Mycena galericulata]|nr:hypothetical protein B0H11DRAFT_1254999 [Mycena galericulata]
MAFDQPNATRDLKKDFSTFESVFVSWWQATGSSAFSVAATAQFVQPFLPQNETFNETPVAGAAPSTDSPHTSHGKGSKIPIVPPASTPFTPSKTGSASASTPTPTGSTDRNNIPTTSLPSNLISTASSTDLAPTGSVAPSLAAGADNSNHHAALSNKTLSTIIASVLAPSLLVVLVVSGVFLYKRRRRARDRREWERTHAEIADAVRQVGTSTPMPSWGRTMDFPLEKGGGDTDPLFDKSGTNEVGAPPSTVQSPTYSQSSSL